MIAVLALIACGVMLWWSLRGLVREMQRPYDPETDYWGDEGY